MIYNPMTSHDEATLDAILRRRASETPERTAVIFPGETPDDEIRLTFGEWDRAARKVARRLQRRVKPGDRVLLLYPPGPDFHAAFMGCLYGGFIAVPAYPPRMHKNSREGNLERLRAIIHDCAPRAALTDEVLYKRVLANFGDDPDFRDLEWVAAYADEAAEMRGRAPAHPDDIAFLQYTSGSTGDPRGVMVTHGNIMENQRANAHQFHHTHRDVFVSWLPVYHDMGLSQGVFYPIFLALTGVILSPVVFLTSPVRWLKVISDYGGTASGAPNFAYDLCIERIDEEQVKSLDLSKLLMAGSGAEPVRETTLKRFAEKFAPAGFRYEAFFPCYGLAEATLIVTGGAVRAEPIYDQTDNGVLTACGGGVLDTTVKIVDPETLRELSPGLSGEVWVHGPGVAPGYWNRPEMNEDVFRARIKDRDDERVYLRTGDLGYMKDGELYLNGRLKDLIILDGRNVYPEDLESTVEATSPAVRKGGTAAFSVDRDGAEQVVMVVEVERRHRQLDQDVVRAQLRAAVSIAHQVQVFDLVFLTPGGLLRTSSGKVRRSACRAAFEKNELPVLKTQTAPATVQG